MTEKCDFIFGAGITSVSGFKTKLEDGRKQGVIRLANLVYPMKGSDHCEGAEESGKILVLRFCNKKGLEIFKEYVDGLMEFFNE